MRRFINLKQPTIDWQLEIVIQLKLFKTLKDTPKPLIAKLMYWAPSTEGAVPLKWRDVSN